MEPILVEDKSRFTAFPIPNNMKDIWNVYKASTSNIWLVEEVNFSNDADDFKKLNKKEQFFIKKILAFFAASDGIVNENLVLNFYNEIQEAAIRQVYACQIFTEAVHNECYSLLIDTMIDNEEEKKELFESIENDVCIKEKAEWALKYISNGTFAERLIAFLIVEGIFFSASFCAIFWIKNMGILPGLTKSNEWISRDEGLHATTAVLIYKKLQNKISREKIHQIFSEAIEIEKRFVASILPENLLGMNSKNMQKYVEFIGDFWLQTLNIPKLYNTENPFPFMDKLNLEIKANFFDVKESNYQNILKKDVFDINEEF